ncbi:MAG: hypothetical protein AB1724_12550 [Thermodesulfobacteriota bacterium]
MSIRFRLFIFPVLFFLLAMMPPAAPAQDQARVFLDAARAYDQGDYVAARQGFLFLAREGVVNGKLYYNIANACLKSGDIGQAILWYEKAQRLIPGDPDLKFNLEYARSRVRDKAPEGVFLPEMLFFWRYWLNHRLVVFLAAAFSFILCLLLFFRRHLMLNPPGFLLYGAAALFVFFSLTAAGNYFFEHRLPQGVVLAESSSVRSGFSDLSTELFVLHAGSRVTVEKKEKDSYRIRFGSDKIGWVSRNEIGII